jgi:hypothetical protein
MSETAHSFDVLLSDKEIITVHALGYYYDGSQIIFYRGDPFNKVCVAWFNQYKIYGVIDYGEVRQSD